MNLDLSTVTDLLDPEVWAAYIVGFSALAVGVYQFRKNFRLNKNASVFDELSKEIDEATTIINSIHNSAQAVTAELAKAANSANYSPLDKSNEENQREISRRIADLESISEKFESYIKSTYESYLKLLLIIKKIEKSTLVKNDSRVVARYLYHTATEQHELVAASSKVLQSFNVTPPLGDSPNISPATFNAFSDLLVLINEKNQTISTFLEDLERALHNDLVKGIYGKATIARLPIKHLSPQGIIDTRVKDSLL